MGGGQIMVVLIVLIAMIGGIIKAQYRSRAHAAIDTNAGNDARRMAEEVRMLKERIAVLERVVTDNHGSLGLDREIERLRDR